MGKLFVIDGLDGSGKATQTQLLFDTLKQEGYPVLKISFPNYDSLSSGPVRMYLSGELSQKADDVNAFAAASFYAVDRYCRYMSEFRDFYNSGGILISDRYSTANAIHQSAKLLQSEKDDFLEWLFDFEYKKLCVPIPDLVIYLSVSQALRDELLSLRYEGDLTKKDIHEKDNNHLKAAEESAEYAAKKYSWTKIICDDGQKIFEKEQIAKQVYNTVKSNLSGFKNTFLNH